MTQATRLDYFASELNSSTSHTNALFDGVVLGGFECACQRLEDGRRLDLLASTRHDLRASQDYARLRTMGMTACRDGVSWVHAEKLPGHYDFSRAVPLVRAAEAHGVQVVWDLMHFGWPDHTDIFAPCFPARFGQYAAAFAGWLQKETAQTPMITPINEISYLSWAGGDVAVMNPFAKARGVELKGQLVLATIAAIEAIRSISPHARFLQPEPVISIVPAPEHPKTWRRVESDNELQYQAWDMLCGRVWPRLGGHPKYLDIVGVNFYPDNQFMLDGTTVERGDPRYRPLSEMLLGVSQRYARPMLLAETGSEGDARAPWFRYVADECCSALARGCELHGVTLYPIVNHPGWADERHCHNGLWDYDDDTGNRAVHGPLANEITRLTPRLLAARSAMLQRRAPPVRAS
jgi:hypothetical protein